MPPSTVSDEEFIELWKKHASPQKIADVTGIQVSNIYKRRTRIEKRYGIQLDTALNHRLYHQPTEQAKLKVKLEQTRASVRRGMNIENGTVFVFSDAHFFPDTESVAYRALLYLIRELQPEVIVANGDIFDGSSISKYPTIMWSEQPTVLDELKAVVHYMEQIEEASRLKSNLIHTLGNHDARFESYLSSHVPQFRGVDGFRLKDHLPLWQPCWSFWINDKTVIKHRHKGGAYAGYNNVKSALGCHVVTGHTHVLAVQPITGYQQTFYGVQTGTLANPKGNQFVDYTEDNPVDWRSGFVILTYHNGQLLHPEIVQTLDEDEGSYQFRGKVHYV